MSHLFIVVPAASVAAARAAVATATGNGADVYAFAVPAVNAWNATIGYVCSWDIPDAQQAAVLAAVETACSASAGAATPRTTLTGDITADLTASKVVAWDTAYVADVALQRHVRTLTVNSAANLTIAAALTDVEVLVEGGTYNVGELTIGPRTTVRSAPGEWATIQGYVYVTAVNATLRDVTVEDMSTDRTVERSVSVYCSETGFSLINCIVLDGGVAIFTSGSRTTIAGNITNGQGYQGASPDRGHGHSCYVQNVGPNRVTVDGNIFGPGFGWSAHAYSQTAGKLTAMDWTRNTAWGAGVLASPPESNTWLMGGSVAATDFTLSDNYLYGHTIQLKYSSEASSGLVGSGGRIDGGYVLGTWSNASGWTSPAIDPGTLGVHVHANAHEAGRANIAVFNPNDLSSTTADCTGIIGAGESWYLYDGFNPLAGPVSSGTGPTVTVPMTGLTCRTPAGCSAPTHPCPKFGAFVVRRTATWVAPA